MKIISIKIKNILSIEDAEIRFDDKGLLLVKGWDYDSNRANGAGKTAIFNALSFALFDKLPRKITASEIVRRGCRTGYAEVEIESNGSRFTVKRSRPKEVLFSSSGLELSITQEEWETKIGLNYNQFMMVAYCSQGSSTRFLSVNDADKKKFLLQLLDLDSFAEAKKKSDEVIKECLTLKDKIDSECISLSSKIEAYSDNLIDIEQTNIEILKIKQQILVKQNELNTFLSVNKPDLTKYQAIEDDLNNKKNSFAAVKAKRDLLHVQYRKLSLKDKPAAFKKECQMCGSVLDTKQAHSAHEKELNDIKQEMAAIKTSIDECDLSLAKEAQVDNLLSKLKNKKREESNDYDIAQIKSNELRSGIQLLNQKLNNLLIKFDENDQLVNKINNLKDTLGLRLQKTSEYQTKIELYKTISSIYSPTGAQAYILDSIVDLFNKSISDYIANIWDSATYELLSYRENNDGDISAKFSEKFTINGKDVSIGSLSGGEYRALSLCVDFALIDVLERQFGTYVSPIILDEPFDGLDSEGRELIVDLLGSISKDRLIIVIDHASETKSMFTKVLSVEKRGGISSINLDL